VRDFYELWIESRCPRIVEEEEEEEEEDALFQDESTVGRKSDEGKVKREIPKVLLLAAVSYSLRHLD
jgi:hypothetical protein